MDMQKIAPHRMSQTSLFLTSCRRCLCSLFFSTAQQYVSPIPSSTAVYFALVSQPREKKNICGKIILVLIGTSVPSKVGIKFFCFLFFGGQLDGGPELLWKTLYTLLYRAERKGMLPLSGCDAVCYCRVNAKHFPRFVSSSSVFAVSFILISNAPSSRCSFLASCAYSNHLK